MLLFPSMDNVDPKKPVIFFKKRILLDGPHLDFIFLVKKVDKNPFLKQYFHLFP